VNAPELIQTVECAYRGLGRSVACGLAVFGAMALKDRRKPLAIIFESPSGYGKSAVVQMFFPTEDSALADHAYRCDKFSTKAFVSHSANVSREKLADVDLLPKLKNKVLLVKELAPIFRGREDELKESFAILIAVLDGKGFTSNSGVHGKRGYEQDIVFNWLGATTPLPRETHHLMYQLGTRLLFYEVPAVEPTEEELLAYAQREDTGQVEMVCQLAVNEFLVHFFKQHPPGSVPHQAIVISESSARNLTRWARLVAYGRPGLKYERDRDEWNAVARHTPEGAYKLVNYFKELARGHALINGRDEVNPEDLELIADVAISSIPGHLRPLVQMLRQTASVDSSECEAILGVTRPTARRYLKELSMLQISALSKGSPKTNEPDLVELSEQFQWLRNGKP